MRPGRKFEPGGFLGKGLGVEDRAGDHYLLLKSSLDFAFVPSPPEPPL